MPAQTPKNRLISPASRTAAPLPRWLLAPFLVGLLVVAIARAVGHQVGLSAVGHVLAIASACGVATWLEYRVYLRLSRVATGGRLLLSAALPAVALLAGAVASKLLDAALTPLGLGGAASAAILLAALWMSSAAAGTLVILLIDRAVSAVATTFRTRMVLAVLVLAALVLLVSTGVATAAAALVDGIRTGTAGTFSIDLGAGRDAAATKAAAAWIDAHPTRSMLLLYGFGGVFALPALISAAGKLADSVMERIGPLHLALQEVAGGARDVHLEAGGSVEFRQVATQFNAMVDELALAQRMDHAFGVYVSDKVRDAIKSQHGDALIPASQRDATVLFADVRGFTAMSERLLPRQVAAVMNRYFARVVDIVDAWDGYLDKFIGDAVVVVWNAPVDQADHADRAVRCALEIQRAVAEMNAAGAFPEVGSLKVGIGIATGQMVCGNIGSPRQMEYTVIGDTVNLAARYCGHAPAHEVWVSERTVDTISAEIGREALSPMHVKGKSIPVQPYRVS